MKYFILVILTSLVSQVQAQKVSSNAEIFAKNYLLGNRCSKYNLESINEIFFIQTLAQKKQHNISLCIYLFGLMRSHSSVSILIEKKIGKKIYFAIIDNELGLNGAEVMYKFFFKYDMFDVTIRNKCYEAILGNNFYHSSRDVNQIYVDSLFHEYITTY